MKSSFLGHLLFFFQEKVYFPFPQRIEFFMKRSFLLFRDSVTFLMRKIYEFVIWASKIHRIFEIFFFVDYMVHGPVSLFYFVRSSRSFRHSGRSRSWFAVLCHASLGRAFRLETLARRRHANFFRLQHRNGSFTCSRKLQ